MAKPIPDGFHTVTPHIICKQASQAIEFYTKALGAEEVMRLPAPDGTIMHAEIRIGSSHIMIAEENVEWGLKGPTVIGGTPVTMHLYVEDCDALYAQAMAAGAESVMKPSNQFYGDRSGGVKDPAGNQWWIATHIEDCSPEEMDRRMREQMQGGG